MSTSLSLTAAALVLVCLAGAAQAAGSASKFQVRIPKSLANDGGYDHREALFGIPPYGATLQQNMYYADSNLCDPNVDTSAGYPIREMDRSGRVKPWPSPYILMVDRGGCTFVNKVRNAQRAGAAGVIIADNTCLCASTGVCTADPGMQCEVREPIMADDGSGADIKIPSFLLFKQDADPIKAELMANHIVRVEMSWSLPNPDARVEYSLWTSPTDLVSRDFLRHFKAAAVALGERAYFMPNMYFYNGMESGCVSANGENECYNLCTNNGRYCATDPDNDLQKGISGADVVRESLRRICAWKIYGEDDGIGVEWWDYVGEFLYRCDNEEYFANEDCVHDAMDHANMNYARVQNCMADSGGLEGNVKNSLLEAQLDTTAATGVVILPSVYVNNVALRGSLEFATVFNAICSGFVKGSEPKICARCHRYQDSSTCVTMFAEGGGEVDGGAGGLSTLSVSFWLLAVALLSGLGAAYYQRTRNELRDQVRGILAEHIKIEGEGDDSGGYTGPSFTEEEGSRVI